MQACVVRSWPVRNSCMQRIGWCIVVKYVALHTVAIRYHPLHCMTNQLSSTAPFPSCDTQIVSILLASSAVQQVPGYQKLKIESSASGSAAQQRAKSLSSCCAHVSMYLGHAGLPRLLTCPRSTKPTQQRDISMYIHVSWLLRPTRMLIPYPNSESNHVLKRLITLL